MWRPYVNRLLVCLVFQQGKSRVALTTGILTGACYCSHLSPYNRSSARMAPFNQLRSTSVHGTCIQDCAVAHIR